MILISYGTRPEYIKIKPLIDAFEKHNYPYETLFTGQHIDLIKEQKSNYSVSIINDENFNRSDLIVKSILTIFSQITNVIDYVLVQGDTTSAFAVALSAYHYGIKIIHLESGLRTYDRKNPYPEETYRRMISQMSDIHLCPTKLSKQNLIKEKIDGDKYVVGNTVIDNLLSYKEKTEYTNKILITLHRRENHHIMDKWFTKVNELAILYPEYEFIFPIHPNPNVQKYKHLLTHINVINPLPYNDMINLLIKTRMVITDSGGLQEECSFFNKKCLICRVVTERPEVLGQSGFIIKDPDSLQDIFKQHHLEYEIDYNCPFGVGNTSEKIYRILKKYPSSQL